jgi:DNA-binding transcriptional LysR family regulator
MNRFDELSALVAVAEQGSFSAAAERLDIAKSAVSRRVTPGCAPAQPHHTSA